MQKRDLRNGSLGCRKRPREVVRDPCFGVSSCSDSAYDLAVADNVDPNGLRTTDEGHPLRPVKTPSRLGRAARVVIPGGIDDLDAPLGQAREHLAQEALGLNR